MDLNGVGLSTPPSRRLPWVQALTVCLCRCLCLPVRQLFLGQRFSGFLSSQLLTIPSPLFLSVSLLCFLPSVFYPLCFLASLSSLFPSLLVKSSYLSPLSTSTKTKKRHPDTLNETRPRDPFSFSPSHHRRAPILRVFLLLYFCSESVALHLVAQTSTVHFVLPAFASRFLPSASHLLSPQGTSTAPSYIHTTNDT